MISMMIDCDILLQVHAVIVCTIRDHAYRVKSLYKELAKEMPEVIIADCIGGNGYMKDLRKAMSTLKPNIIVGTIGRIDTLNKKMRFLQDVRFLVCEEMGLITKYPCKLWHGLHHKIRLSYAGLILGLRPANERRLYKVTSLIGWAQTYNQPC